MANLSDAKLISIAKLRNFLDIGQNYSPENVGISVLDAQHIHIRPALGGPLYDKLIADIEADTTDTPGDAFSGDYKVLVESYIHPALRWAAYIELLMNSFLSVKDNGISRPNQGAQTTLATKGELNVKVELAETRLNSSLDRLNDYISFEGSSTFPELEITVDLDSDRRDETDYSEGPAFVAQSYRDALDNEPDAIYDYYNNRYY